MKGKQLFYESRSAAVSPTVRAMYVVRLHVLDNFDAQDWMWERAEAAESKRGL